MRCKQLPCCITCRLGSGRNALRSHLNTHAFAPACAAAAAAACSGYFGWEDYFGPIMDAITTGGDYYLVANDFPGYLDEQVGRVGRRGGVHFCGRVVSCIAWARVA